jgi:hypothetical protein
VLFIDNIYEFCDELNEFIEQLFGMNLFWFGILLLYYIFSGKFAWFNWFVLPKIGVSFKFFLSLISLFVDYIMLFIWKFF